MEYAHIKKKYIPYIYMKVNGMRVSKEVYTGVKGTKKITPITVADMSHSSLNVYQGLVRYAKENTHWLKLHFVRIRRDRIESAISMSASENFMKNDYYRYSPMENRANIINKVDEEMWNRMHLIQKALWFIDETEARWQKLLKDEPWLPYTETFWGNRWTDKGQTIMKVAQTIADLTDTVCNPAIPKTRVHAGKDRKENTTLFTDAQRLDEEYHRMMRYDHVPTKD
jgi:hypothetical protein